MSSKYLEDWERKKWCLIRSLFEDIPALSPVPEQPESASLSSPDYNYFKRSDSPLPPLNIERVPYVNKHDEPEEFYIGLEIRMRRLYRKMFKEGKDLNSISSATSLNIESPNKGESLINIDETITSKPNNSFFYDADSEPDSQEVIIQIISSQHSHDSSNASIEPSMKTESSRKSSSNKSIKGNKISSINSNTESSSDNICFSQEVVVSAQVHRDPEMTDKESMVYEDIEMSISQAVHDQLNSNIEVTTEDSDCSVVSEEKNYPSSEKSSLEEVEVMRRKHTASFSLGSLRDLSQSNSGSENYLQHHDLSEEDLEHDTFNISNKSTSMKSMERSKTNSLLDNSIDYDEINSLILSYESRKRQYNDKCVQTTSAKKIKWENLKSNFFVGTPSVYRLCKCAEHDCNY